MFRLHASLATIALSTVACGGSANGPMAEGEGTESSFGEAETETADAATPPSSPFRAGVADPCADPLDTGYLNDDLCLDPPPADMGFQLHFGPDDRLDYDDPEALAPFILEPGGENTVCQYRRTPNEETRFVMEQHIRVRSGTHHLLIWGAPGPEADESAPPDGTLVVGENCGARDSYLFQTGLQSALGEEGGVSDIPTPGAELDPRDRGLARLVRPNASVVLEMHYINTTDEPLLREAWTNTIYTPEDDVKAVVDPLMFLGGLSMEVPPQSTEVVGAGPCEVPPGTDDVQLIGINGHGHAHMDRLSAWITRADGRRQPIYETFDWSEPLVAQFSDVAENPPLGVADTDGAHSGALTMGPGDQLLWECEITNDLDHSLRWANEAYESEMCNVFGYYTARRGKESMGNWNCFTP